MILVRYISWTGYDSLKETHPDLPKWNKDDVKSAILDDYSRIKKVSNKKYIVLGRTPKRELLFCVVEIIRKFTISPIYIRPMNDTEKLHFRRFQPEHIAEMKGLDI